VTGRHFFYPAWGFCISSWLTIPPHQKLTDVGATAGEYMGNIWDFNGISMVNIWLIMVNIWLMMVNNNLVGGFNPSEKYESHLG